MKRELARIVQESRNGTLHYNNDVNADAHKAAGDYNNIRASRRPRSKLSQRSKDNNSALSGVSNRTESSMAIIELYTRSRTGEFLRATDDEINDQEIFLFQKFVVPEDFQPRAARNEYWDSVDQSYMYAPAQVRPIVDT